MINVNRLRKTYGDFVALDNFNMTIKKGSTYCCFKINSLYGNILLYMCLKKWYDSLAA